MTKSVRVDPSWLNHPITATFQDFDAVAMLVISHPGFMARTSSKAYRFRLEGEVFFIKYYQRIGEKEGIRLRHFTRSKPSVEWRNIQLFETLGVATVQLVAMGEQRRWGMFQSGFIISRELENAVELGDLRRNSTDRLQRLFTPLVTLLAESVRKLHAYNFFHNDLNWRNVLVREEPELEVFLIDSPNGRRWLFPFREFRLIKDLASLDRVARRVFSRTQRLRFYLLYSQQRRLTARDKRRIGRVVKRSDKPLGQEIGDKRNFIE
jgi:hypothetical protein